MMELRTIETTMAYIKRRTIEIQEESDLGGPFFIEDGEIGMSDILSESELKWYNKRETET